jgi:hypothetical protein
MMDGYDRDKHGGTIKFEGENIMRGKRDWSFKRKRSAYSNTVARDGVVIQEGMRENNHNKIRLRVTVASIRFLFDPHGTAH